MAMAWAALKDNDRTYEGMRTASLAKTTEEFVAGLKMMDGLPLSFVFATVRVCG